MSKTLIKTIVELTNSGWRPYTESPHSVIYEKLGCSYSSKNYGGKSRITPFWFVKGDIFLCVGCSRGCTLSRPEGFILPLPIAYEEKKDKPFALTPRQMIERKALLRVDEVAYCLNISERLVRDWVSIGKLRRAKDPPVRVCVEDVIYYMKDLDE